MSEPMGDEILVAEMWLTQALKAAMQAGGYAPLVFQGAAEEGAAFPVVVFSDPVMNDVRGNGAATLFTWMTYVVKATAQTRSFAEVVPLNVLVYLALHKKAADMAPYGRVLSCV